MTLQTAIIKSLQSSSIDFHNHIKECCKDIDTVNEITNHKEKKRILIVDDEPDVTSLFRMSLEDAGFKVDTFNDPANTLKNFKPNFYDLIILDIVMPDMDGIKLYYELKNVELDLNVCFLTASEKGRDDLSEVEDCKNLILYKPISILDLLNEVNKRIYR